MLKDRGDCIVEGCGHKAVNSRLLCQYHTKERHLASAESKGMTVKTKEDVSGQEKDRLLGYEHGSHGKKKIPKASEKKISELAELAKIKKEILAEHGRACSMCGTQAPLDLFHIISVGDKRFSTDKRNLLLSCRMCHLAWTAMDYEKMLRFKNWQDIMARLLDMDEGAYWKLRHRVERFQEKLLGGAIKPTNTMKKQELINKCKESDVNEVDWYCFLLDDTSGFINGMVSEFIGNWNSHGNPFDEEFKKELISKLERIDDSRF